MHLNGSPASPHRKRGFALITALVMLLVITILALAGARMAIDTKRMSRNQRDTDIAFQAAEAALRDAEHDIQNSTSANQRSTMFDPASQIGFAAGCNTGAPGSGSPYRGLCTQSDPSNPIWLTVSWSSTATNPQTVAYGDFTGRSFPTGNGILPAQKPRYIIEEMLDTPLGGEVKANPSFIYRITAVGWGPNNAAQVMLQSIYRKVSAPDPS